jgi:DNA-binding CsgD family transcriptional regulator
MYTDSQRPLGREHCLMVCLPEAPQGTTATSEQHVRLYFIRGPGPDFSDRDRAVLTLLRPHLHQAYRAAEQRRHPVPRLTRRQNELLRLLAAGHTNSQIARQLGISEGTVRTHLETIYDKLGVSSRTAAVTRAFPDGTADRSAPAPPLAPPGLLLPSHAEAISLTRDRLA